MILHAQQSSSQAVQIQAWFIGVKIPKDPVIQPAYNL